MAKLTMTIQTTGDQQVATINGKTYSLLRGYKHDDVSGWFFLAVAGKTPLKADDLDKHWAVVRREDVCLAFAQRPFSYHLAVDEENPEAPYGCDWPKLKSPPAHYAFVGLDENAVTEQVRLVLEQHRPDLNLEDVLHRARHVADEAGGGPDALLITM